MGSPVKPANDEERGWLGSPHLPANDGPVISDQISVISKSCGE